GVLIGDTYESDRSLQFIGIPGGYMYSPKASRRDFLKITGASVAGTALSVPASADAGIVGANDRVRVAICGVRRRGHDHIRGFSRGPGTELAGLCDVDENILNQRLNDVQKMGLPKPKSYVDVRKLLEDKEIDAISIATPNHWHALMTIWGCQAGKDVYVEKPCSHNVHEGRIAVEAAKRYGRIVQHGTQSRSSNEMAQVVEVIKSGQLGKLLVSRGLCYKSGLGESRSTRASIGYAKPADPPKELDFNLWLGPAKEQPYHDNLVHY